MCLQEEEDRDDMEYNPDEDEEVGRIASEVRLKHITIV
jgi:hypothetical protein